MSDLAKVGELYTPLRLALKALEDRSANTALRRKVDQFFGGFPPPRSFTSPCAVYAPALVTPNLELTCMMDIASELPIPVRYYEFAQDKFVHLNYAKRSLGDLTFFNAESSERLITGRKVVVDFQSAQGQPMNKITTLDGENFVDFHHRILRETLKEDTPAIEDFSDWFKSASTFDPALPYTRYLGLFLTGGILFANFTTEKREVTFTEQRVLPAFRALREQFGISPLIVPVQPTESDDEVFWCYYPDTVRAYC
jgi:hypothetical protein